MFHHHTPKPIIQTDAVDPVGRVLTATLSSV